MDNLKAKIHDACLDHESEILDLVEDLGNQRNKNYETGRIEDIDLMIPILNGIEYEVERYREYKGAAKRRRIMSRTNFNQFIYGRQKGKFAGNERKKRRIKRGRN